MDDEASVDPVEEVLGSGVKGFRFWGFGFGFVIVLIITYCKLTFLLLLLVLLLLYYDHTYDTTTILLYTAIYTRTI